MNVKLSTGKYTPGSVGGVTGTPCYDALISFGLFDLNCTEVKIITVRSKIWVISVIFCSPGRAKKLRSY